MNISEKLNLLKEIENEECLLESNRLELAFRKGNLLIAIKNVVPHGQFETTLKKFGCKTSLRTAQRQMLLAENEEFIRSKTTDLSHLTVDTALMMIRMERKSFETKEVTGPDCEIYYKRQFNRLTQKYEITIEIPAEGIGGVSTRNNSMKIARSILKLCKEMNKFPALLDKSKIPQN